jgi:carbon-monoxide dehydrogenase iron sulfur subunit
MRVLAVRPDLCTACGACEETCAMTFYQVPDRERSAIRVMPPEVMDPHPTIEFCDQCGECIAVCPTEALYRAKNGIVRLRKRDCVGCMACVGFCPSLVMYVTADDPVPFKCIACGKCVDDCPTEALYMVEEAVPPETTELTRSIRVKTGIGSHAS